MLLIGAAAVKIRAFPLQNNGFLMNLDINPKSSILYYLVLSHTSVSFVSLLYLFKTQLDNGTYIGGF